MDGRVSNRHMAVTAVEGLKTLLIHTFCLLITQFIFAKFGSELFLCMYVLLANKYSAYWRYLATF